MDEPLSYINISIKEAYKLLESTHDYVKWQAPLDVQNMYKEETLKLSCEAMRITVRMTQIISWLMLQKAILSGDITREEASSDAFCVLQGKTCLEEEGENDMDLPFRLRELLKESRKFYVRILRLDERSRDPLFFSQDQKKDKLGEASNDKNDQKPLKRR